MNRAAIAKRAEKKIVQSLDNVHPLLLFIGLVSGGMTL